MKKYLVIVLILASFVVYAKNTTEKRIALVIGNNDYKSIDKLYNAINDANSISQKLQKMNFDVILGINLTKSQLNKKASEFREKLRQSNSEKTVALLFYSGHGVEINGTPYIVSVDYDQPIRLTLNNVLKKLTPLKKFETLMQSSHADTNIIISDACRDNPFGEYSFAAEATIQKSINSNKDKVKTFSKSIDSKTPGIYYAFGTSTSNTASDGDGKNGLFTKYILKYIGEKGYNLNDIFTNVGEQVYKESNGRQRAWSRDSFGGNKFYFNPGPKKLNTPKWLIPVIGAGLTLLLLTFLILYKQRQKIAWANSVVLKDELKRDKSKLNEEIKHSHLIRDQIVGYLKDINTDKIISLVQSSDKIILGRQHPADFIIDDKVISSQHCEISYNPSNKTFQVKDLNSSNGIWLSEDQQIKPGKVHTLKDGQVFYLATEDHPLVLVKSDK